MIRRPPRSTLFPSTTLSRSGPVAVREEVLVLDPVALEGEPVPVELPAVDLDREPLPMPHRIGLAAADALVVERRDRKSTRLNSSHANISYAVFCLKKKNSRY